VAAGGARIYVSIAHARHRRGRQAEILAISWAAADGAGVVVVSSEIEEILAVADPDRGDASREKYRRDTGNATRSGIVD